MRREARKITWRSENFFSSSRVRLMGVSVLSTLWLEVEFVNAESLFIHGIMLPYSK